MKKITMKTARLAFLSALTVMAVVSVSQHAAAQLVIDDFSSGFYTKTLSKGSATDTQTGTMAGGSRMIIFGVCEPTNPCATNPYEQPNSYQIKKATQTTPNILIFNTGYKSDADLLLYYGEGSPMSLDLSSYDRIRLFFDGANLEGVNLTRRSITTDPSATSPASSSSSTGHRESTPEKTGRSLLSRRYPGQRAATSSAGQISRGVPTLLAIDRVGSRGQMAQGFDLVCTTKEPQEIELRSVHVLKSPRILWSLRWSAPDRCSKLEQSLYCARPSPVNNYWHVRDISLRIPKERKLGAWLTF
jgi:hypothetical protein